MAQHRHAEQGEGVKSEKPTGFRLDVFSIKKSTNVLSGEVSKAITTMSTSGRLAQDLYFHSRSLGQYNIIFFHFVQWRDVSQKISWVITTYILK